MKALIFNSGIGKRMGELTKNSPKSMVKLLNGETIFERQIRLLSECGIKDIVVTTGPFEEQLKAVVEKEPYRHLNVIFVHNDLYDKTNYIYSFYLAQQYLNDDVLMMHGDLVFNKRLLIDVIAHEYKSLCLINKNLPLPEKDFKGRIIDNKLREVGINIFDDNCFTFQPLYKIQKEDLQLWIEEINHFVASGNTGVYAENAFNVISEHTNIIPISYENYYINEIDNVDDYQKVTKEIEQFDYKEQETLNSLNQLPGALKSYRLNKPLIVTSNFLTKQIKEFLEKEGINFALFDKFSANPIYENVLEALAIFKKSKCDSIISIGGGSAIDIAKCLKLFLPLKDDENYLKQEHKYINLKHIAVPTTAGTGSESTRFAVIYYQGVKQSIADDMILPDIAILDESFLPSLPLYQKKATMLDALCQAIESMWSKNSTEISKEYSKEAITIILNNYHAYLNNDLEAAKKVLKAANTAGRAINITQTTAAHAMSYKLTSYYGIAHGHAVALCLPYVWDYLAKNVNDTFDERGVKYVQSVLDELNKLFLVSSTKEAINKLINLLKELDLIKRFAVNDEELELLANSINTTRLSNYPIHLEKETIKQMYAKICAGEY